MRSTVDQAPIRRATTNSAAGIMASLSYRVGAGGDAEGDTYFSIENLFGSLFADALVGNDGNNRLDGLTGDDFLDGRDGTDMMFGGSGNDTLKGGGGADWLDGNEGIDTVSYYELPEGVIALLGNEGAYGDAEGDTYAGHREPHRFDLRRHPVGR